MNINQAEQQAVEMAADEEFGNGITYLNMTGDVTLTWDSKHDEKIKALIRKQMEQGVTFFTLRKVVIDAVKIRRKIAKKGVDTIDNLVLTDEQFENLVAGVDDKDLAELLTNGTAGLGKRRGEARKFEVAQRAKTAEEVIKAKQALAVRRVVGG